MGTLKNLIVVAMLIALPSCLKHACEQKTQLMFRQNAVVMSKPFPQWYRGVTNDVVKTMRAGQTLPICRLIPAKDFAVYEVKLSDGRVGYVEYDPARMREIVNK
jgi:(2Fe-2S) ferredoxin